MLIARLASGRLRNAFTLLGAVQLAEINRPISRGKRRPLVNEVASYLDRKELTPRTDRRRRIGPRGAKFCSEPTRLSDLDIWARRYSTSSASLAWIRNSTSRLYSY